jgi:hypothetical protein
LKVRKFLNGDVTSLSHNLKPGAPGYFSFYYGLKKNCRATEEEDGLK